MTTNTMEPKVLAAKLGISAKRLRAMLRADRPRVAEMKGKKWEIPTAMAKEVEKAYKAKKAQAGAEKKAQIEKELHEGEEEEKEEEEKEEGEEEEGEEEEGE